MEREYADYLIKKTKADYNLIAQEFSQSRERVWEEMKIFIKDVKAGEKILDLGCGNGRLYKLLKDKKIEYFGVDQSEKLIEIARSLYPEASFEVSDLFSLPFPDQFFDKVYSFAVFHHLPLEEYRIKALKETKRVLKKEGKLFLTVWNLLKKWQAKKLLLKYSFLKILGASKLDFKDIFYPWKNKKGEVTVERYIHLFSQKELEKILKKAGFGIEESFKNDNIGIVAFPL
jgi:ubiquinone/menaquinone biosynthesis C-methylase UbiE